MRRDGERKQDRQLAGSGIEKEGCGISAPSSETQMAKTNPFEFFQQVRNETSKVTWPSRRETLITTIMVFVFTTCAAIFFLIVDWMIRTGMSTILSFLR
jgi:preprotein translocase subunit SecE